ncbi:MAG: glycosyltransferase family 25 protein [Leptothrix sp. (in: b-proteobacteria)]
MTQANPVNRGSTPTELERPPVSCALNIPACVINLAEQTDRWLAMERECHEAGLDATRLDAVLGRQLHPDEVARIYSPALNQTLYHQGLTPGEIGCYASHIQAWRALLATGQPCGLVLEDDVHLAAGFTQVARQIAQWDAPWDMVKLIGRRHEQVLTSEPLDANHQLVRYRRVPSFTSAYLISRRGADKLLASRVPFGRPIDIDLRYWWENDLQIYGVQPYPVRLSAASEVSSIQHHLGQRTAWSRVKKVQQQVSYSVGNWLHRRSLSR